MSLRIAPVAPRALLPIHRLSGHQSAAPEAAERVPLAKDPAKAPAPALPTSVAATLERALQAIDELKIAAGARTNDGLAPSTSDMSASAARVATLVQQTPQQAEFAHRPLSQDLLALVDD